MSDLEAKWKKIQTIQDFAFILSLDSVTMEVKGKMRDILKAAQLGEPAPNLELVDLTTKTKLHLLSLAKAGRPFVVNFGSGSWPPFMANLGKFGSLRKNFSQVADFVTIYIAEAHPADRGHFKTGEDGGQFGQIDTATHKSLQDRIGAALKLKEKAASFLEGCPILVSRFFFTVSLKKSFAGWSHGRSCK